MKLLKFHQFVLVEKGPVNSLIVDFLQGHVLHVSSEYVDLFLKQEYKKIPELMEVLKEDKLIVEIDENRWVPSISFNHVQDDKKDNRTGIDIFTLEIDRNVDIETIHTFLSNYRVARIFYYGEAIPDCYFPGVQKEKKMHDFDGCQLLSCIDEDFQVIEESEYEYNMQFNSCWGGKVAICNDLTVRPCIYSEIIIGDIREFENPESLMSKIKPYWELTKDIVERCKGCELRYACFDCREIPFRKTGNLYSENPSCSYQPNIGEW